jgi:hypothetical protein|tara:strand:- start:2406 stop:2654 length:249 start_codon:yes stop_codon:yes gene_type:complete
VVVSVYNIVYAINCLCSKKLEIIMDDADFVKSELKVTAAQELEDEVMAELEEDLEEKPIASLLNKEDNEDQDNQEEEDTDET